MARGSLCLRFILSGGANLVQLLTKALKLGQIGLFFFYALEIFFYPRDEQLYKNASHRTKSPTKRPHHLSIYSTYSP